MRIFRYSSYVFIIVLTSILFLFSGCGNGLGGLVNTEDMYDLENTDPEKTETSGNSDPASPIVDDSEIYSSNITSSSAVLDWSEATDNNTSRENLEYCIVYSELDIIDTVQDAVDFGTPYQDCTKDINNINVAGLKENTTFYFNIIVKDDDGNQAVYLTISITTANGNSPAPGGDGILNAANITETSLDLDWTLADDDVSSQENLEYKVVISDSNNIDTVADAENNGTIVQDWTDNLNLCNINNLTAGTDYYLNVLVKDQGGNVSVYTMINVTTADTTLPVPGAAGTISTANIQASSLDLNWTNGTDNVSALDDLEYIVYMSNSGNINSAADAEANGTVIQNWTSDIAACNAAGLSENTMYYFNVLVRDKNGLKSAYSMVSATTLSSSEPAPGNSGIITSANITETALDLNWTKATDDITAQVSIEYKIVRSGSNNIDTVSNAESNGILVQDWTADIAAVNVTGLSAGNTYYFNIIARDEAALKAAYTMINATTADLTSPVPGNSGTITTSNLQATSLDLNWAKGSDNVSAQNTLEYIVYRSDSNNIDTLSNAELNGTIEQNWTTDIAVCNVTGLSENTAYYFNILIRDEAGLKTAYTMLNVTTASSADPVPGNTGTITTANITETTLDLNWTKAADDLTPQAGLEYKIVRSDSNNIDTVSNAESNGTLVQDWTADIATCNVTGLSAGTVYYFNIIVRDGNSNKAVYTMLNETTSDTTDPVPGNSGILTTSNVQATSFDINWTKGSDNVSVQTSLEYIVYRSDTNNIDTILNAETNGTLVQTWTTDIATCSISGLSEDTVYYFNVLVRDEAGLKSAYIMNSILTMTSADPVPGNTGTLTESSVGETDFDLNWTEATDDVTSQSSLEYKVFRSNTNNIDSVVNAETNGTMIKDWTTDISFCYADSLTAWTTYYFNVIVRDGAGNKAAYTMKSVQTDDTTNPTPGNSGTITTASIGETSLDLNWTKATDNTPQGNLEYKIYRSDTNNIDTINNANVNGTLVQDWTADIATCNVTGLSADTTYYFNVLVRDQKTNDAAYTMMSETTAAGGGSWTHPANLTESISPAGTDALYATVEMDHFNQAIIAWSQENNSLDLQVFVSEYRSGSWTHPVNPNDNISPDNEDILGVPSLAMDNNNNAIVTWQQITHSVSGTYKIFLSKYDAGLWMHPSDLTDYISPGAIDANSAANPKAAMDDNGNAIITYTTNYTSYDRVYISEYRSSSWTHPALTEYISTDVNTHSETPFVAMDNNNNAIVNWRQINTLKLYNVAFLSEYRSGSWSHPAGNGDYFNPASANLYYVNAAMDNNGNAIIVWEQTDLSNNQIFMSEYRSGSWTHPSGLSDNISPDGDEATSPRVAMDDNGNAIIVWAQEVSGGSYAVFKSEYRSGSWTHPADINDHISTGTYEANEPEVAMSNNGDAVITWQQYDNSIFTRQVFISEYRSGSWTHPADLDDNISPNGQHAVFPDVAMDNNGKTIVVWRQNDGSNNQIFMSEYR